MANGLTARERALQQGINTMMQAFSQGADDYSNLLAEREAQKIRQDEINQRRADQRQATQRQDALALGSMGYTPTEQDLQDLNKAYETGDYGSLNRVFGQARQGQIQRQREREAQKLQREQQRRDLEYQRQLQRDQRNRDFELNKLGMQQMYKGMERRQKLAEKEKEKSRVFGKDPKEFSRRFSAIVSEAENLKNLINKKGTFEMFGEHENVLNQKLESLAVDAAKLYDPQSVARESEVQSFKNMLFQPGLTTANKTAIGTLDSFVQMMKDRAAREAELENNERLSQYLAKYGAKQVMPTNYVIASPAANDFLKDKDISQLTDEELMQLEAEEMRARGIGNVR